MTSSSSSSSLLDTLFSSLSISVLVVGGGAREHALVWKLLQSSHLKCIYVAPGNAGTALLGHETGKVKNVPSLKETMVNELVQFAKDHEISLVIPGPERCLVAGISDAFRLAGIPCFGPSQRAAQLEGSKAFSKQFMVRHQIPTASFQIFSDYVQAITYIDTCPHDVVIKVSGLANGKGVVVPNSKSEAKLALHQMMVEKIFGDAGQEVVIEEKLIGHELSVLALCDGYTVVPLPSARDYKRVLDQDQGPNTGGMGAYAPASSMALVQRVYQTVLLPTVHGLRKEGCPFVGVLYAGLMVSPNLHSFHVLEFNVRFGDPETQVLMPLVHGDLLPAFWASCHGFLDAVNVSFRPSTYACTVVLASKGYPSTTSSNPLPIHLPPQKSNDTTPLHEQEGSLLVFHASTQWTQDDQCMTLPGAGRVMCITTSGPSLEQARTRIYQALKDTREVHFEGMHYRQDIGQRTLEATPLPMSLSSPTKTPTSMGTTYQDAGVSMDQGDELVRRIQPLVKATKRPGANADLGGFGGCFDLGQAGFSATDVLVAATDGVGTKLKLAFAMNRHDTIGIDLVAMNVNDIVVQGAQPLFFLDYFGCGHLDVTVAFQVIQGIVMGCQEAGCALIGGETAEMPSMYPPNEYDVAGFCVGAVSPSALLPKPDTMQALDCVLGWVSSGLHSNGFSLVRHVVHPLDLHAPCPFDPTRSLGDVLLTPTRIYVKDCLKIASLVKGMAHITGGGLLENIPRILPSHLKVTLNAQQWPSLPIFRFLQDLGQIEPKEMLRTFNCGLGMVVIASPEHVAQLQSLVPEILVVGVVHARASADEPQVEVENFN